MWIFCVEPGNLFFLFLFLLWEFFFPVILEISVMCFVWVCFPSLCVCLVDAFNQFWAFSWSISLIFTSSPQPPWTFYYHILYLPGCFYNFLFSFPSLCIYFFLYHGGMSSTFISQPLCCIIHFYYIVNFQELFFYFWLLPLLKVFIVVSRIFSASETLDDCFWGFCFCIISVSSKLLFSMFILCL